MSDNEEDRTELNFIRDLYLRYYNIHAYVAICLGLAAIICNILIIWTLTRPKMTSTVNLLLTAVAFNDCIVFLMYLTYMIQWRLRPHPCDLGRPVQYGWAVFEVFFADVALSLRGLSMWLTVAIAALRHKIVKCREPNTSLNTDGRISWQIIAVCSTGVLLMGTPIYLTNVVGVVEIETIFTGNRTECDHQFAYFADHSELAERHNNLLYKISYWSNGLFFRFIPCVLLTFYIPALIFEVSRCGSAGVANRRRNAFVPEINANVSPFIRPVNLRSGLHQRTTYVLIAILITCWLTESPHSLMSIWVGLCPEYDEIYRCLGDIFDLLSLINSFFTFALYGTMSRRFRQTFSLSLQTALQTFHHRTFFIASMISDVPT